jgi:hypothetical protein
LHHQTHRCSKPWSSRSKAIPAAMRCGVSGTTHQAIERNVRPGRRRGHPNEPPARTSTATPHPEDARLARRAGGLPDRRHRPGPGRVGNPRPPTPSFAPVPPLPPPAAVPRTSRRGPSRRSWPQRSSCHRPRHQRTPSAPSRRVRRPSPAEKSIRMSIPGNERGHPVNWDRRAYRRVGARQAHRWVVA